jgi:hypothetical protein
MEELYSHPGQAPDPEVPRAVSVKNLEIGAILAADVKTKTGLLVASQGTRLLGSHVEKLQNFARISGLQEPLYVLDGPSPVAQPG